MHERQFCETLKTMRNIQSFTTIGFGHLENIARCLPKSVAINIQLTVTDLSNDETFDLFVTTARNLFLESPNAALNLVVDGGYYALTDDQIRELERTQGFKIKKCANKISIRFK